MKLKYLKTFEGYKLEPHRNYEEREEIYKQKFIKLFNTEVINGDLNLSNLNFNDFPYTDLHKIKEINGDLIIENNTFLNSLFPLEKVNNVHIYNSNIKDFGNIKKINGNFDCSYNQLTSLESVPNEVTGNFYCYNNQLTSLKGAPKKVTGNFSCSYNQLTSLKGAPNEVTRYFSCSNNQLISLEGAPNEVNGDFYCNNNQLTSLEGSPKEVNGNFNCYNNQALTEKDIEWLKQNCNIKGKIIWK